VSQLAARVRQLESQQEDIDAAIKNMEMSTDATKCYLDHIANDWGQDIQIGDRAPRRSGPLVTIWMQGGMYHAKWQELPPATGGSN